MGFNLGAGLSEMGQSIATTAGAMGLEQQKSDLMEQRDQLAAQTAHGYKSQEMEEQGGIAATAASSLADVNAKAAKIQQDFETGLEKIRSTTSLGVANIGATAQVKSAGIEASASMANVRAQLQEGDIQVAPDGTMLKIDRSTGKSTPVTDDSGNPVKGIIPGQAALVRDTVNSTNEQLRALTIRYDNELKGPQAALDQVLKTNTDQTSPDVIAAKQAVDDVKKEYQPAFTHLNTIMDSAAAAMTAGANLPVGNKPGNGQAPPAAKFDRTPAAPSPQTSDSAALLPGLINAPTLK